MIVMSEKPPNEERRTKMKAIRNFDINPEEFTSLIPFIVEARDYEASKIKKNPLLDESPLDWTTKKWIRHIIMAVRCFEKKMGDKEMAANPEKVADVYRTYIINGQR
jgi:hypothetical protein